MPPRLLGERSWNLAKNQQLNLGSSRVRSWFILALVELLQWSHSSWTSDNRHYLCFSTFVIRRRGCSTCLLVFLLAVPETCEHLIMRLISRPQHETFNSLSMGISRWLIGTIAESNHSMTMSCPPGIGDLVAESRSRTWYHEVMGLVWYVRSTHPPSKIKVWINSTHTYYRYHLSLI